MGKAQGLKVYAALFGLIAGLYVNAAWANQANPSPQPISAVTSQLTLDDYHWIGQRIYINECAGQPKYLTHWGEGEAFPSFGIGHFIWFPAGVEAPFVETFPNMLSFVSQSVAPPVWLSQLDPLHAPWKSKPQFEQAWSGQELSELRDWLLNTQAQQAQFIVHAFEERWLQAVSGLPFDRQAALTASLSKLMASKEGMFAAIDYFNFKGMGANPKERYRGQEWGLISVLRQMQWPQNGQLSTQETVRLFVEAAKQRLTLRTQLAPKERHEQRWLKGWFKRLDGYLVGVQTGAP